METNYIVNAFEVNNIINSLKKTSSFLGTLYVKPKFKDRNWLLMSNIKPEPTLMNYLLLAQEETYNKENKQVITV